MALKPWHEIAGPYEDVLKGTFQQAEFAADLSRVLDGTATPECQYPAHFFQRTFITESMRLLLDSVKKRLAGKGGGCRCIWHIARKSNAGNLAGPWRCVA